MATIEYGVSRIQTEKDPCHVISWLGLATNDDGQRLEMPGSADRTVQVGGTFGGSTCIIEGSNDGVNYLVLTDPQGNNLSFTSAKIETVTEITRYIRPRITGGSGASINIHLLVRRNL